MQTQQQEEREQLINRVLRLDPQTYLYSGLGANVGLIVSEIEREVRQGALDWMAYDVQSIHRIAVNKANRGALCANPRYVEAFQVAFSGDATQKSGIGANEQMILKELSARELECTPENILTIIGELWDQLADNPQYTQDKASSDRRDAQISAMTQGGTTGFTVQVANRKVAYTKEGRLFDPMYGQAQGFSLGLKGPWSRGADSRGFVDLSNDEVQALYDAWKATQDFRSMSVEDLRKLVKSNGSTDLFGKNVRVPSAPAPDGGQQLINEATGKEFTQRELIRYLNSRPSAGRELLVNPNTGRMIPWKKERFEKIIRGELG